MSFSTVPAPRPTLGTLASLYRPTTTARAIAYDLAVVFAASLFIALTAQISFDLPFSLVPVTGQSLGVLLVGVALGSTRGLMATALYVAEGCAGWPVFAGGDFGVAKLLGPTGGYLVGFMPAAWVAGWLAERGWDRDRLGAFLAMLLGTAIIFWFGVAWLSFYTGFEAALWTGFVPFLPGGVVKMAIGMAMLPAIWRVLGKASPEPKN